MESKIVLECKNLTFKYSEKSKREIVSDFSFSFERGKIYLITGFSGCGKSTLAYILTGLYPENKGVLSKGSITFDGIELKTLTPPERAKKIMLMFQNCDTQFCMETVEEELIFTLENINYPIQKIKSKLDTIIGELKIEKLRKRRLETLSGGEKQKVALACVLAVEPEVIILDEPFANVDYRASQEIINMLIDINKKRGITLIIIDHRITLWKDVPYIPLILEKGCKFSEKNILTYLEDSFQVENFKKIHVENKINRELALKIESLSVNYRDENLLENFDMEVPKGRITALLGESGKGKTTLLKTVCGILSYSKGSIEILGKELKNKKSKELLREVGIVFQNPQNQFVTYRVSDEIAFTLKHGLKSIREAEIEKKVKELLEDFNLYEYKNFSPFSLSQGQQRKLAVLSMLCGEQKILLCDEPTYAQDNKTSRELMEYLKKRCQVEGLTILMVSHDINLMIEYADYIYELDEKGVRRVEYSKI